MQRRVGVILVHAGQLAGAYLTQPKFFPSQEMTVSKISSQVTSSKNDESQSPTSASEFQKVNRQQVVDFWWGRELAFG